MKFNYKKIGPFLRPIIPVEMHVDGMGLRCELLIDSGADATIVDASLGEALGIDIKSGKRQTVSGITPGQPKPYFLHPVSLKVGGWAYNLEIGFMPNMPPRGHRGVLGQRDFFDLFKIVFDLRGAEIELKPYDVRSAY